MFSIRRAASFVALIGLMSAPLEILVPDVHDGDFASEVAAPAAGLSGPSDDAPAQTPTNVPGPSHEGQIDHCAHSHSLDVGMKVCYTQAVSHSGVAVPQALLRPASISLSPDQRPPIA